MSTIEDLSNNYFDGRIAVTVAEFSEVVRIDSESFDNIRWVSGLEAMVGEETGEHKEESDQVYEAEYDDGYADAYDGAYIQAITDDGLAGEEAEEQAREYADEAAREYAEDQVEQWYRDLTDYNSARLLFPLEDLVELWKECHEAEEATA